MPPPSPMMQVSVEATACVLSGTGLSKTWPVVVAPSPAPLDVSVVFPAVRPCCSCSTPALDVRPRTATRLEVSLAFSREVVVAAVAAAAAVRPVPSSSLGARVEASHRWLHCLTLGELYAQRLQTWFRHQLQTHPEAQQASRHLWSRRALRSWTEIERSMVVSNSVVLGSSRAYDGTRRRHRELGAGRVVSLDDM